jgi:hypothetical protein
VDCSDTSIEAAKRDWRLHWNGVRSVRAAAGCDLFILNALSFLGICLQSVEQWLTFRRRHLKLTLKITYRVEIQEP